MGRLSAVFVAICLTLIAGSVGVVVYLWFGFTGMEATVVAVATATALAILNSVTRRARDRSDLGAEIADVSRATADIARQISELDRRMAQLETGLIAANDRTAALTEPLGNEIDELGELVKDLADAVATHERALAERPVYTPPPAAAVAAVRAAEPFIDLPEPEPEPEPAPPRAASGRFKGVPQSEVVSFIARAVEANRVEVFLQPIVTLPQRKVRYYEALTRLRDEDDTLYAPEDYGAIAEDVGLTPAIDNLMVFRSVQVTRRLTTKNRDVGLFCNMSTATLANATVFQEIADFLEANRALSQFLVFQFPQATVRQMGLFETEALASLAALGFRFSIDQVSDLRIEPRELAERGFRFIKVPASLLLGRAAQTGTDIHPADFSDLLGRFGIDLIADRIERESTVVDLLDYDVRFAQGTLFSPPRPVRTEVMHSAAERSASSAPAAPSPRSTERAGRDADPPPRPEPRPVRPGSAMAQLARSIVRRA